MENFNSSNINDALNNVRAYFTQQLAFGVFDVLEITMHKVLVEIDSQKFCLWVANGVDSLKTYSGEYNSIALEFNSDTQILIWNALRPHFDNFLANLEQETKQRIDAELAKYEHLK